VRIQHFLVYVECYPGTTIPVTVPYKEGSRVAVAWASGGISCLRGSVHRESGGTGKFKVRGGKVYFG